MKDIDTTKEGKDKEKSDFNKKEKLLKEFKEMVGDNYFIKETNSITKLKHFPYDSFDKFTSDVQEGKIILGIARDYAKQWLHEGENVPTFPKIAANILILFPFLLALFFLVAAFSKSLWLLVLTPFVPIWTYWLGNPTAGKFHGGNSILTLTVLGGVITFFMEYNFIFYYILLPIIIGVFSIRYLFSLGVKTVKKEMMKNEKLVCHFWKMGGLNLQFSNGDNYSQRTKTVNGITKHYEDVDREWKEYIEAQEVIKNKIKQ